MTISYFRFTTIDSFYNFNSYLFLSFVSDTIFLFTLVGCWLSEGVDLEVFGWCCCDTGDLVFPEATPLEPGDLFGVDV